MTQVWQRLNCGGGELLLALALADIAGDDGERIYPSIKTLAEKTRQGKRTVQRQLANFRAREWLEVVYGLKGGRKTTTHYRINPIWIKGANLACFPDKGVIDDAKGCQLKQERVPTETQKGDIAMAYNPSSYPSLSIMNHPPEVLQKVGVITDKDMEDLFASFGRKRKIHVKG